MEWLQNIDNNKKVQNKLYNFLNQYGLSGLEQALQQYIDMQQEYTCCTRESFSKIKVSDIYYMKIHGHRISVHTATDTYKKYGTLSKELKTLSHYGFIKCHQSYIVSLTKIKTILSNEIILINNQKLPMSRNYTAKVMVAFHNVPLKQTDTEHNKGVI